MKFLILINFLLIGSALFAGLRSSIVLDPKERQSTVKKAGLIQHPPRVDGMVLRSPFFNIQDIINESDTKSKGLPHTPEEILHLIAANLHPTGFLRKGTVQTLFLSQGSLKVGESFTASVAGKPYTVRLTHLTDRTFTLELDQTQVESLIEPISSKALHLDP